MARCPECSDIVLDGCNCYVEDTDCFRWDGNGEDAPYRLVPVLSADVDQLLTCNGGLDAQVPALISNPPTAKAYHSTMLSISNNTETTVSLNSELYDTDTMHDVSSNNSRITFTTAGVYIVTLNLTWDKSGTGDRIAKIRKNGTDVLAYESKDAGGADLFVGHNLVIQEAFSATDYVEARVTQTSGGALLIRSETHSPVLTAERMAA